MCGIFGAVAFGGASLRHPEVLDRSAVTLRHRGPDGERILADRSSALGACRLAIVDLATGDQPFESPDGTIWVVCNGEIYNFSLLRKPFADEGYPFRSRGDVETIVPLYERYGLDAIPRLEGMFGLAIWDGRRSRLVLARDRAGEKPLFWTESAGELRFASEIQALLCFPDQRRRLNRRAAALYRALGYVPSPHTMLDGIHKLPPAHLLVADERTVKVQSYWDPAAIASQDSRLQSGVDLRDALLRAVERELMSDVPIGVFTSGGLDSTLLAAAAARWVTKNRLHTFSVEFVEPSYDESAFAEATMRRFSTTHHKVTADQAALRRALDVISDKLAEPAGDPAILPTYLLAEAAREHVKVILSGEGADELFGGYPTYLGHQSAELYRKLPHVLRRGFRRFIHRLPTSTRKVTLEFLLKQFSAAAELPLLERHLTWFGALGPTPEILEEIEGKLGGFPDTDPLNRILWLDFLTYLPDNLLVKVDRATMLASLEARAPYLDREVMELTLPAPSSVKVRGWVTKAILKEAARGLVPAKTIHRRKRGLSVPVAAWLKGGLAPLATRLLERPRMAPASVGQLLTEHRAGQRNHARKLWPLLMAELWAEKWKVECDD